MSNYRSPNTARILSQHGDMFQFAGQVVTLRTYVSASAGVPLAGLGSAPSYAERTITALFSPVEQIENQSPAGMFAAGQFVATTREPLGRNDELRWRGTAYRVDSDATPAAIAGTWMTVIKRGR